MIVKLILRNFMAHAHTEIALGPGLTVLCGPNNTGKSAVVEALRCLAYNPAPKHYIRHGAKQAEVEAVLSDATRVLWVRRKGHAIYKLYRPGEEEPQTYAKFGRYPPDDIRAALRLNCVEIEGGEEVDVHLGNQREPVFMIHKSGSYVASFFAASSESAHLVAMQSLLKDKVRKSKQEKQRLETRKQRIEAELDKLGQLPAIALELENVRRLGQSLEQSAQTLPKLEELLSRRIRLDALIENNRSRLASLNGLKPSPALYSTQNLATLCSDGQRIAKTLGLNKSRQQVLSGLQGLPEVYDTTTLSLGLTKLVRLRRELSAAMRRQESLASLSAPPVPHDVSSLGRIVADKRNLELQAQAMQARLDILSGLAELRQPAELRQLETLLADLRKLNANLTDGQKALQAAAKRLQDAEQAIEAKLASAGACPLCGNSLDLDKFIRR